MIKYYRRLPINSEQLNHNKNWKENYLCKERKFKDLTVCSLCAQKWTDINL